MQTAHRVNELMADATVTMEEALKCVGCGSQSVSTRTNRLGELLVMAGIVQTHEVEDAIVRAQALGLPFGRCLLLSGLISPALLETAINAQRLVRRKRITKEDAVSALAAASHRLETDPAYFMAQCYQQAPVRNIRLGELLTLAGIVSESQVQYAVEMGLLHNLPLGHLLLDVGLISRRSLDNALVLQKMVANGSVKPLEAVYALIDTHYYGYSLAQALSGNERADVKAESVQFTEFLVSSGVASKRTIRESLESAMKSPQMVGKALLLTGAMDENNLQIALRCHFYVREGMLSFEEGVVIYDHAIRMGLTVEEAVGQLGFELRQRKDQPVEHVA